MAIISLQCNGLSQYIQVLIQAENSMTGRAYMRELSADTSLAEK